MHKGDDRIATIFRKRIAAVGVAALLMTSFIQPPATGAELAPTTAPTNVRAAAGPGAGEISLTWDAPLDPQAAPTAYRVYRANIPLDVSRTHDNSPERQIALDNLGDRALKFMGINGTTIDRGFVRYMVYAKSANCDEANESFTLASTMLDFSISWDAGSPNLLDPTYTPIRTLDPCRLWPSTHFAWASLDLPVETVPPGCCVRHILELEKTSNYFGNDLIVAADNVHRASTIWDEGVKVTGDLHWYSESIVVPPNNTGALLVTLPGSARSFRDTTLPEGQVRGYYIKAVNEKGEGPASSVAFAQTYSSPLAPLPPTLEVGPGDDQITLRWFSSPFAGRTPVTSYRLYRLGETGPVELAGEFPSVGRLLHVDSGLAVGATYSYWVTAVNLVGPSSPTLAVSGSTRPRPGDPPGPVNSLRYETSHCEGGVRLLWDPPTTTGGDPVRYYRVYRTIGTQAEELIQETSSTVNTVKMYLVQPNVDHSYRVTAINGNGESPGTSVSVLLPGWGCYRFTSSDEGFVKQGQQALSEIQRTGDLLSVVANKADQANEMFVRTLDTAFDLRSSFEITSDWTPRLKGDNQIVAPLFFSGRSTTEVFDQPNSAYIYYYGGATSAQDQRPTFFVRYRDPTGKLRINSYGRDPDTPLVEGLYHPLLLNTYKLSIGFDAPTRTLRIRVYSMETGTYLVSASYVIGSNPFDAFDLGKFGVSTYGRSELADDSFYGTADNFRVWYINAPPTPPASITATSQARDVDLAWTAPAYDGRSAVTGYQIYRRGTTGAEQLIATVNSLSYRDTGLSAGNYRYRVVSMNGFGAGGSSATEVPVRGF